MTTTTSETTLRCGALVEKVRPHLDGTVDRFPVTCSAPVQWVEGCLHRGCTVKHRPRLHHVDPALDDQHRATL